MNATRSDVLATAQQLTNNELKKNHIIMKECEFDDGTVSSIWFYIVQRINKKTISVKACNRTGIIDEDATIEKFNLREDDPTIYIRPQTWTVINP
jgi:hypothetical protein